MKRILFVCTGNICRSPTAEGIARHVARARRLEDRFEFDSAGTYDYHAGEAPDSRARTAAKRRGYDLSALRARQVETADFHRFDLILAMDRGHLTWLAHRCPPELRERLHLFLDFVPGHAGEEVLDPYYGGGAGFEHVLDLCEAAVDVLLKQ
ncbi:MAG: phosphotyrosine protein phosphatase [Candidatus Dactylopiibacterium carminicum]|uniref:protein-tyrosine-phosphatase n=1 Tax=Candidatus Dactylopiibacterium carminicum TaxID=857335 RepID=A0A272ES54_9RHOO|nr:low molecular weight protein-tyrosine-phosphatase [Candidatus Dactylopiibacterium carminicum]KAF7598995.1 low molecular weight phosphotyrosine protein phosphatase [Candidatus Dactylopiibacterium carminicum]PAS92939.1 MAG: phosphotyrosine protein phosphatase [Candidatus Dactylopiibacterium carminicum]PAS99006.1 MAG: phosphotyrosine protein phosphatase [Candidatus Dactylopiibacterium carminicum]